MAGLIFFGSILVGAGVFTVLRKMASKKPSISTIDIV